MVDAAPCRLIVSIRFDPSEHDSDKPALKVTDDGFAQAARRLAAMRLPTILVQEGGYLNAHLGNRLRTFLRLFETEATDAAKM